MEIENISDYWNAAAEIQVEEDLERQRELAFEESYRIALENGFFVPEGRKSVAKVNEFAYHMRKNYEMIYSGHDFYHWEDGYYQVLPEIKLKYLLSKATMGRSDSPGGWKGLFVENCAQEGFHAFEEMEPTDGFLNLANGVLDVKNKKVTNHNPKFPFYYRMNIAYDENARCPTFMKFLHDVFAGDKDSALLVQQFIAYSMIGGDPFLHKALCLVGEGRNGKSTLLDVITALLGHDNVSTVSLGKIGSNFNAAMLNGKLANIVEESPTKEIDSESFKNIIGGGSITMEKKYKDPIRGSVHARFIFATNHMPVFKDRSAGLVDRLEFLKFPRYFKESERDYGLKDILMNELPGILNWVLEVLPIDKKTFRLVIPKPSVELKQEYEVDSNSIMYFVSECIEITSRPIDVCNQVDLYRAYCLFCQYENIAPLSNKKFGKGVVSAVQKCGLEWEMDDIKTDRDNRGKRFRGFRLKA